MNDFPTDWCVTDDPRTAPPRPISTVGPPAQADVWIEHLDAEDCWALLASAPVGRIGVLVDSAPEIYPVNHVVDDETVVFRTDPGGKLHGLARSPSVSFEVDGADADEETGWSVLIKGRADEVQQHLELRRLEQLPLRYWGVGEKEHWIRIEPIEITGRRIHRIRKAGLGCAT